LHLLKNKNKKERKKQKQKEFVGEKDTN